MEVQEKLEQLWRIEAADGDKKRPRRQKKVIVSAVNNMSDILWDKLSGRLGEA